MILVNVINKLAKSEIGTFLLCAEHYEALQASHIPALFAIKTLNRHCKGECIECTQDEPTPIEFDPVPEQIEVYVTFEDGLRRYVERIRQGWTPHIRLR